MLKKRNIWLKAAAVLAFFMGSAIVSAQTLQPKSQPLSPALQELTSGVVLNGLDAIPTPQEINVPEAAPAKAEEIVRANGPAPAPGKDFSPLIQDQARIDAIMKLVTDIYNGKHLPYSQDGATFKNKEGILPQMPSGFYKEYTLLTGSAPHVVTIGGTTYQVAPDLSARGSERIIIGGGEKIYYTPDHYKNFILLAVVY